MSKSKTFLGSASLGERRLAKSLKQHFLTASLLELTPYKAACLTILDKRSICFKVSWPNKDLSSTLSSCSMTVIVYEQLSQILIGMRESFSFGRVKNPNVYEAVVKFSINLLVCKLWVFDFSVD